MMTKTKLLAALCAGVMAFGAMSLPVSANSRGDVDGDGKITIQDAYQALMAYASESAGASAGLTSSQRDAADVNRDGALTIQDAYQILMYYAMESAGQSPSWEDLIGDDSVNWKQLYREFLEGGYLDLPNIASGDSMVFGLLYIDDDDIPELGWATDSIHSSQIYLVTVYEGEAVPVTFYENGYTQYGFGSYGSLLYQPRENLYCSGYMHMGITIADIFSLKNGSAALQASLLKDQTGSTPSYTLNKEAISEARYEALYESYGIDAMTSFNTGDMVEVTAENLDLYLG